MNRKARRRKFTAACTAVAFLGAAFAFAPVASAKDGNSLAAIQKKVPFTVYTPKFTTHLPLISVKLSNYSEQAVGADPGKCTYYLTTQYGGGKSPMVELVQSYRCSDPPAPMAEVATFKTKGQQVTISTACPNASATGEADCLTGSTATPQELLQQLPNLGETWIPKLPARGGHLPTTANISTSLLSVSEIKKVVRSLVSVD
ncbi:MAG: hypothetical protein CK552_02530 [Actinobacteria bacterium]|nr:MAG: hypothetical protein CK552_02530 [Actinomycetota bacterium]